VRCCEETLRRDDAPSDAEALPVQAGDLGERNEREAQLEDLLEDNVADIDSAGALDAECLFDNAETVAFLDSVKLEQDAQDEPRVEQPLRELLLCRREDLIFDKQYVDVVEAREQLVQQRFHDLRLDPDVKIEAG